MNRLTSTAIISCVSVAAALLVAGAPISASHAQGLTTPNEQDTAPVSVESSQSDVKLEIAQRLLNKIGLLQGQATGRLDNKTEMALREFSRRMGLQTKSTVDDSVIAALRGEAWRVLKEDFISRQDEYIDSGELKEVQKYLKDTGFDPGPIDGTFGAQTMSAIEAFQDSQRIAVDGAPTRTVLMNLRRLARLPDSDVVSSLRILNWSDYIEPELLEEFERKTKIRVVYDVFDSPEALVERLGTTKEPYDIIVPSADKLAGLAKQRQIQEINRPDLSGYENIDPTILRMMQVLDPDNKHGIPYMWGTVGIAYNSAMVEKYAPEAPTGSLEMLFNPVYAKKLSGCGVGLIDSPSDVVPLALMYVGLDPSVADTNSIRSAGPVLQKIKPFVKVISSSDYIDALAKGKICVALMFSGDALQARDDTEAGDIVYRVPDEGSTLWFDVFAITSNAPNREAAQSFLNFMLDPQNIARATNYVNYANANSKSGPYISKDILGDAGIYPPQQVADRLVVMPPATEEAQSTLEDLWERFKNN